MDDERIIREGLKSTVDWKFFDCQVVGEAKNGSEGIEKAKELNPDLIIADIKMPKLDGLEMAEKIQEFNKECKFIIITGYGDFEYAKRAIKLDAVDFIQKPIDDNELLQAVEKASSRITNERKSNKFVLERYLLDAMRGDINSKSIIEESLELNHGIEKKYQIVLLQINDLEHINKANLEKELYGYIKGFYHLIQCHENIFAVLMEPVEEKKLRDSLELMVSQENKISNGTITVGVSENGSIRELQEIYEESKKALKNKLYTGEGSVNFYHEVNRNHEVTWNEILKKEMDLRLMLKTLNESQVEGVLKDIYKYMLDNYADLESARQVTIDLVHIVNSFKRKNGIEVAQVYKDYERVRREDTIEKMESFIIEFSLDSVEEVGQINTRSLDDGLSKVVEYINGHFTEDLSLRSFAKELYLSEGYLSKRLKEILGMSYSEYITFLRIEKSVELLKSGQYKVSDVARMVGYSDYRYFSRVFKRQLGFLPSEI